MDTTYTSLLFEKLIGIQKPWTITRIDMEPAQKHPERMEMHVYVDFLPGSEFPCPVCGEACKAYDAEEKVWRHLNIFQYRCYLHARVPRVRCESHGVRTVEVPWGRAGSGFTLLMEGVLLTLLQAMPVAQVAREVGETDTRLWRLIARYVEIGKRDRSFTDVSCVGVDEYSHKGHDYVTIFLSPKTEKHSRPRVLDVQPGKGSDAVKAFGETFCEQHGHKDNVTDVTSDMCHGYLSAMKEVFPGAAVTVDKFHVVKNQEDSLDAVRRREMRSKDKRKIRLLDRTRYLWLKNREELGDEQRDRLDELLKMENLDTVIAYNFKLRLQEMYEAQDYETACRYLEEISLDMAQSGIPEMLRMAKLLTHNALEILQYFVSRKTNAILEGFNSKVSIIKNRARGFRVLENFMNMIFFCLADFDLPKAHLM